MEPNASHGRLQNRFRDPLKLLFAHPTPQLSTKMSLGRPHLSVRETWRSDDTFWLAQVRPSKLQVSERPMQKQGRDTGAEGFAVQSGR